MKRTMTGLLLVLICAPLANAESPSQGIRRIGKTMSASQARLADPTLRVLSAGKLLKPEDVGPDIPASNDTHYQVG